MHITPQGLCKLQSISQHMTFATIDTLIDTFVEKYAKRPQRMKVSPSDYQVLVKEAKIAYLRYCNVVPGPLSGLGYRGVTIEEEASFTPGMTTVIG